MGLFALKYVTESYFVLLIHSECLSFNYEFKLFIIIVIPAILRFMPAMIYRV